MKRYCVHDEHGGVCALVGNSALERARFASLSRCCSVLYRMQISHVTVLCCAYPAQIILHLNLRSAAIQVGLALFAIVYLSFAGSQCGTGEEAALSITLVAGGFYYFGWKSHQQFSTGLAEDFTNVRVSRDTTAGVLTSLSGGGQRILSTCHFSLISPSADLYLFFPLSICRTILSFHSCWLHVPDIAICVITLDSLLQVSFQACQRWCDLSQP